MDRKVRLYLLLALLVAAIAKAFDQFRKTNQGKNPWSVEGLVNVIRITPHIQKIKRMTEAKINSVYRSERVNSIVGGVKTSRHLRGLAADFKPGIPLETAIQKVFAAAERGELGPVRKIIREPTIFHVSWRARGESKTRLRVGNFTPVRRV